MTECRACGHERAQHGVRGCTVGTASAWPCKCERVYTPATQSHLGRWHRRHEDVLATRIRDLESQLAQARAATDHRLVRDMLSRAGIETFLTSTIALATDEVYFIFGPQDQLVGVRAKGIMIAEEQASRIALDRT